MQHDSPSVQQAKAGLFWSIYCLDKALSLRLGRASSIQDYDISLSMDFDAGYVVEPWITIYPLWMRLARIQGKVYESLYSPAALSQPEDDRVSHARQLASEMQLTVMDPFKVALLPLPPLSVAKAKLINEQSESHPKTSASPKCKTSTSNPTKSVDTPCSRSSTELSLLHLARRVRLFRIVLSLLVRLWRRIRCA